MSETIQKADDLEYFDFEIYKKNISSQSGEDGIIEEIFRRIKNLLDYQCCEFGAWDGKHLSNTYNLIKNHNYKALLIEGDKKKFQILNSNFLNDKVIKLNKFVEFEGKNTLDNILENNNFNKNFDFLSIDIDGNDYHIFDSLKKFLPKLISIEYNPTIPNHVNFVQKKDNRINQGSSARSLIDLALKKNYFPIASTKNNLFFIQNSIKKFITKQETYEINKLLPPKNRCYIFCGYDGSIHTSKEFELPWHKLKIDKISVLPFFLIGFPDNYNFFQKLLFIFYKFYIKPLKYLKNPKKYIKILIKEIKDKL